MIREFILLKYQFPPAILTVNLQAMNIDTFCVKKDVFNIW